ncbi:hypothetical protein LCGC14_1647450 [marine sediment metagenome]|uniref:Uncharacterized protein n=1 Tax=marine sediment metagenome TaxID=412755 RepID=A0A0F9IKC7_9ZZZZ
MDPIIQEIYRTYFEREYWMVVGMPNGVSLLSALQVRSTYISEPFFQAGTFKLLPGLDRVKSREAFDFVKKYSTWPNI